MERVKYFIIGEVTPWKSMEANMPFGKCPVNVRENGVGFLKAYTDEDLLKKEHPGKEYFTMQSVASVPVEAIKGASPDGGK